MAAALAPVLAPFSPTEFHIEDKLQGPSATYWFGTDQYGRDLFSRVLYGGRSALLIASAATALGLLLGGAIGMAAAYYGRAVDEALMRTADAMLSFPSLLLAMLILTMMGPSLRNLVVGIAVVFAPRVARVMRSVVLSLRNKEFVEAARLRGESGLYIMGREILPNALAPMVVEGSIRISYAILLVGTLGFLGLGVQPPSPDWGLAVSEARNFISVAPWLVLAPSAAIATLVVGVNLLADGLHRAVDPASATLRPRV
jgi:peptide/nickel transport system permease protein